jgi:hypothetical protein
MVRLEGGCLAVKPGYDKGFENAVIVISERRQQQWQPLLGVTVLECSLKIVEDKPCQWVEE